MEGRGKEIRTGGKLKQKGESLLTVFTTFGIVLEGRETYLIQYRYVWCKNLWL